MYALVEDLQAMQYGGGPSELGEADVPPILEEYKSWHVELLTGMKRITEQNISTLSNGAVIVDMENNPDFLRLHDLMSGYVPLVQDLQGKLKISTIDPLLEKVELEINRLYLELSSQQE